MMNRRAILYVLLFYFASVVIPQYPFPVHEVDSCPKNRSEWYRAGARLNCSYDEKNTLQYLCIPNEKITTLLEFCSYRLLFIKGYCPILYPNGNVRLTTCKGFTFGCPEQDYFSSDTLNYSSCLEIDKDLGCFQADSNCYDETFIIVIVFTLTGAVVSVGLTISIILCILRRRITKRQRLQQNLQTLDGADDMENNKSTRIHIHIMQRRNYISLVGLKSNSDSNFDLKWKKDKNDISNKYKIGDGTISIGIFSEEDCGIYQGFTEQSRIGCCKRRKRYTYPVTVEFQKLKLIGVDLMNSDYTISKEIQSSNSFSIWDSHSDHEKPCVVLLTESPSDPSSFIQRNPHNENENSGLVFILKCAALLSEDFSFPWNNRRNKEALKNVEKFLNEKSYKVEVYKNVALKVKRSSSYKSTLSDFKLLSGDVKLETLWILLNRCRSPQEVLEYISDQRLVKLAKEYFRLEGYIQHADESYILLPRSVANIYLKCFHDEIFKTTENRWKTDDAFDQRICTEFQCFVHYALYRDLPTSETVLQYFRTSDYEKGTKEECIIVPSEYNENVIEKMDVDIIVHKTFKDVAIHEAVVKLLTIPEEVIGWNVERKQRFIEELKKGKARIHRARVIVVGCAGAGKTTLVERLKHPEREEMPKTTTTVGLDVHKNVFLVDGRKLILMGDAASLSYSSSKDKMITVMDFAGQSAYYACHQVYLTKRAIYLLVTDMSKPLEVKVGQNVCDADETVFSDWKYGDYISFWLQSIRTYCGEEMPVVLVATHKDKTQKSDKSFYDEILHSLPQKQNLKKHLSTERYFEIAAAPQDNNKILDIQDRLIDFLTSTKEEKSYSHWGEFIPSFWLTVERELERNQKKVMCVSQIKDRFNLDLSEDIDEDEDLDLSYRLKVSLRVEVSKDIIKIRDMLQFFHEIGYILFFNETPLNDVAILDVQWFINAFKSLTMDKNQVDVAKATNNSNTKIPTLEDCFQTTKDMDEFYRSGKLPCEILQQFWESHDDKDLQENSGSLLRYMERLGLLATGKIFHYIPCVNKKDIDMSQLERISSKQHKTSVMHFLFKHCLHHFFFQRVVVACMHKWKYLEIDGKIQLFKNIVLLEHKRRGNVIVIGVNKTAIQLLVYSSSTSRLLRTADTYKVRNTVEKIISSVVRTFHRAVNYEVGFSCLESDKITQECEGQFILEKDAVAFSKLEEGRQCDYHTDTHYIHWSKMVKHWNKDQGLRLGCFSRKTKDSTVEGIAREVQTENSKPLSEKGERHVFINMENLQTGNNQLSDEDLKKLYWMLFQKLIGISRDALQIYFDGKFSKEDLKNVLKTNENDMKKGQYRFRENDISILFPDDESFPLSSTFDITIMYKLLRNYGEEKPEPSQGWGKKPHLGDKKETDDLERVRHYRNKFFHATPATSIMEKDDFEQRWMDLSNAIDRLSNGKLTAKVNELKKEIPT